MDPEELTSLSASTLNTGATGFLGLDKTNHFIVLSFRGTVSLDNVLTDVSIGKTGYDKCNGCELYRGFSDVWLAIRDQVLAAVQDAVSANPDFSVAMVGHSLGGALAELAAHETRLNNIPVALVRPL